MLFEWYSGSDETGRVPDGINRYSAKLEELAPDDFPIAEQNAVLSELLAYEADPNWRGYLCYYLAEIYLRVGDGGKAVPFLLTAISDFNTLAWNFRDVRKEYACCLYELLLQRYSSGDESWIELALRMQSLYAALQLGVARRVELFLIIASALRIVSNRTTNPALLHGALAWLTVVHHLDPEDPEGLALLIYVSYETGNSTKARRVWEMFRELNPSWEGRARLEQFVREKL